MYEENQKQIESCIKLFSLMKLLLDGNASFLKVMSLFEEAEHNSNTACVTLNKYINTLKIFGINIIKDSGCYKILNPPYKINLSDVELNGFNQLYYFLNEIENDNNLDIKVFLKSIQSRFSEKLQADILKEKSKNQTDFTFYYKEFNDKIRICKKFCTEEYKTEIVYYKLGNKKTTTVQAKIEKLIYNKNKIKLGIINLSTMEPSSIAMDKIVCIRQLPTKTLPNFRTNKTIIFQISNRLAENYTPRKWEYLDSFDDEGNKVFINKDEDENELLHRILRYKTNCKILSPQSFKNKLLEEVDKTLQLYE